MQQESRPIKLIKYRQNTSAVLYQCCKIMNITSNMNTKFREQQQRCQMYSPNKVTNLFTQQSYIVVGKIRGAKQPKSPLSPISNTATEQLHTRFKTLTVVSNKLFSDVLPCRCNISTKHQSLSTKLHKIQGDIPWLRQLVGTLSLCRSGFDHWPVQAGFVADKAALGQVFLQVLWFSLSIPFHSCCLHIFYSSAADGVQSSLLRAS